MFHSQQKLILGVDSNNSCHLLGPYYGQQGTRSSIFMILSQLTTLWEVGAVLPTEGTDCEKALKRRSQRLGVESREEGGVRQS